MVYVGLDLRERNITACATDAAEQLVVEERRLWGGPDRRERLAGMPNGTADGGSRGHVVLGLARAAAHRAALYRAGRASLSGEAHLARAHSGNCCAGGPSRQATPRA